MGENLTILFVWLCRCCWGSSRRTLPSPRTWPAAGSCWTQTSSTSPSSPRPWPRMRWGLSGEVGGRIFKIFLRIKLPTLFDYEYYFNYLLFPAAKSFQLMILFFSAICYIINFPCLFRTGPDGFFPRRLAQWAPRPHPLRTGNHWRRSCSQ